MLDADQPKLDYETSSTREEDRERIPDGYLGHRTGELDPAAGGFSPRAYLVLWVISFIVVLSATLWIFGKYFGKAN